MEEVVENYSRGIARALLHWAGVPAAAPRTLPDLRGVGAACEQIDGGCTATSTYWPRRFQGHRLVLDRRRPQLPRLLDSDVQKPSAVLVADWVVPDDVRVGEVVHIKAFGRTFEYTVPSNASPGSCLRLRQAQGTITASLLLSATATVASAVMASTATAAVAAAASTTRPAASPPRARLLAPPHGPSRGIS